MLAGLMVAVVCFGWLVMAVAMGRREYRRAYRLVIDWWGAEDDRIKKRAHKQGIDAAYKMIYGWPLELIGGAFEWLVSTTHLFGVPDAETDSWQQVDDIQIALDMEAARQRRERARPAGHSMIKAMPPRPPRTPGVRYDAP